MESELFTQGQEKRLIELAERSASDFQGAAPFPHVVLDGFLPEDVLERVLRDYPEPEGLDWIRFHNEHEKKLAFNEVERLPESTRELLLFLNSAPMLRFLEALTGIPGLIPDPYFVGGGLHQIRRGGHLDVHIDFNKHRLFQLERRLNLLVYLNKDWPEQWGGHLELWDGDMKSCVRRVLPVFNRCVVFATSERSFHGHPHPLTCPPDRARRSVATYYYTNGRPESELASKHSTVFRDTVPRTLSERVGASLKRGARAITPPILMNAISRSRRR